MNDIQVKYVQGSNNGVYCIQLIQEVNDGNAIHHIPIEDPFVFMDRWDPNFPFATGDLNLMKRLLQQIKVDNKGQGWHVPLSNGPIQREDLRGETNGRGRIAGAAEVLAIFLDN